MPSRPFTAIVLMLLASNVRPAMADDPPPVSERARKVHESGMLFDGHNDLPWRLRAAGDMGFDSLDISKRLDSGQTDIPSASAKAA